MNLITYNLCYFFQGTRCENCIDLRCHNGGTCQKTVDGTKMCICSPGYSGPTCDVSKCDNYCKNVSLPLANLELTCPDCFNIIICCLLSKGYCRLTDAGPKCQCLPGYTGKRCDQNACKDFCQNGGEDLRCFFCIVLLLRGVHFTHFVTHLQ